MAEEHPTPTPPPVAVEPVGPAWTPPRHRWSSKHRGALLAAMMVLAGGATVLASPLTPGPFPPISGERGGSLGSKVPLPLSPETGGKGAGGIGGMPPPVEAQPAPAGPRADAQIKRTGYAHIWHGILFVPSTFSSEDGTYDLLLHFHGNTRVVLESAEHAGLNAVVAVVNIGKNSAPYLDAFAAPGIYAQLLGEIGRALGERGLSHPTLRRVALSSWSGGYGALSRIIEHGEDLSSLDAVLVLDGIHCGYLPEDPKALNVRIISPFAVAAKEAADGQFLFSITHSDIEPEGYAGTAATSSYLLDLVHGRRGAPRSEPPEHLALRAGKGAVSKRLEKRMEPTSEASVGMFHVRGYRGNTPEHHMAHLLQMGATVMPELAGRWRASSPRPR